MHSRMPKVMHELGGRTLLAHVIAAAKSAGTRDIAVVVGPEHDTVQGEARRIAPEAQIFEQRERRGTAHAVLSARKAIARGADDILIIFGDTPLVRSQTLAKLREALADGAAVAVLGFRPADPKGYGRLLLRGNELAAIREERDSSPEERKIDFCNGGLMALAGSHALGILSRIGNKNAKGEYYLTDAVAIARDMGLKARAIETSEDDVRGINTKTQLAETEAVLQQRLRAAAMETGVTMQLGPGNLKPGPAALARAKKIAFAAQAQVFLGDPEAVFGFTQNGEPRLCRLAERCLVQQQAGRCA